MEKNRWLQRLNKFEKAFKQLEKAVDLYKERELTDLEKQGLIQAFEHTFELSWNLLRDYLIYQGISDVKGSRDAFRLAFKYGIIEKGEVWMEMIQARNLTSHTYDEEMAKELIQRVVNTYYQAFKELLERFKKLQEDHG